MGKTPWNKGVPIKESTRIKLSISQKGEKGNRYGKHHTKEAKEKISNANKGKIYSETSLKKMSENRMGKCCKEQNPNWNGGTSFGDYCYKFNERRKRAVRLFFKDMCICCSKHVNENIIHWKNGFKQIEHSVHHIDHNRDQGCGIPFNLVPLCHECHAKELHYQDEFKKYINKTLESGFDWGIWSREQYELDVMYPE